MRMIFGSFECIANKIKYHCRYGGVEREQEKVAQKGDTREQILFMP